MLGKQVRFNKRKVLKINEGEPKYRVWTIKRLFGGRANNRSSLWYIRSFLGEMLDDEYHFMVRFFKNILYLGKIRGYSVADFGLYLSRECGMKISGKTIENCAGGGVNKARDVYFVSFLFKLSEAAVRGTDFTVEDIFTKSLSLNKDYIVAINIAQSKAGMKKSKGIYPPVLTEKEAGEVVDSVTQRGISSGATLGSWS